MKADAEKALKAPRLEKLPGERSWHGKKSHILAGWPHARQNRCL